LGVGKLLTKYENIFAGDNEDYGRTNEVYHRLDTIDPTSIRQPPRRITLTKQAELKEMLDNMQRHGFTDESDSPLSSPVVLVRKKNGEIRFCVDYKKLNDITKTTL
jgi:hypothetical protein